MHRVVVALLVVVVFVIVVFIVVIVARVIVFVAVLACNSVQETTNIVYSFSLFPAVR